MSMQSKIPSYKELEQWIRSGMSNKEASERYASMGLDISPTYISVIRSRQGWPKMYRTHSDLIPWVVELEHRGSWDHKMLQAESTLRQGGELDENRKRALEKWKANLAQDDLVVHYDAATEEGWWRVPRRQGVDTDLIRQPSPEDEDEGMRLRH